MSLLSLEKAKEQIQVFRKIDLYGKDLYI